VDHGERMNHALWTLLADELAERLAERLAPRLAELVSAESTHATPWLTTSQAVAYTGLPEGTFRKLVACGKIPSHGGRSKIFYRSEVDDALLGFSGLAEEARQLKRVG
jgi:excisionase family DNA binding protein